MAEFHSKIPQFKLGDLDPDFAHLEQVLSQKTLNQFICAFRYAFLNSGIRDLPIIDFESDGAYPKDLVDAVYFFNTVFKTVYSDNPIGDKIRRKMQTLYSNIYHGLAKFEDIVKNKTYHGGRRPAERMGLPVCDDGRMSMRPSEKVVSTTFDDGRMSMRPSEKVVSTTFDDGRMSMRPSEKIGLPICDDVIKIIDDYVQHYQKPIASTLLPKEGELAVVSVDASSSGNNSCDKLSQPAQTSEIDCGFIRKSSVLDPALLPEYLANSHHYSIQKRPIMKFDDILREVILRNDLVTFLKLDKYVNIFPQHQPTTTNLLLFNCIHWIIKCGADDILPHMIDIVKKCVCASHLNPSFKTDMLMLCIKRGCMDVFDMLVPDVFTADIEQLSHEFLHEICETDKNPEILKRLLYEGYFVLDDRLRTVESICTFANRTKKAAILKEFYADLSKTGVLKEKADVSELQILEPDDLLYEEVGFMSGSDDEISDEE
jgi:hypothetical protein